MPTSLGLYIEDNLIKYAKVSKNNEVVKIESFGVKFYENITTTIKQIIEETYSFNNLISINTNDEIYNEIEVFKLLSKKDIDDVIKTEFEHICYEKDINKNLYEQRHIFSSSNNGDDKLKTIHIALPKTQIEQRKNQFSEYKISNILPVSISVSNLIKEDASGTVLIVNIEKNTTVTKITNGIISKIDIIENGSKEILDKINKKENSYSKAYEVCKASTIYTEADKDLQYEENEYLEDIMPTLFQIVSKLRVYIDSSIEQIGKVYITGTAVVINNLDIYFQEYLKDISCEILKPSFISNNSKINIKDYIEVNSAIAIAVQGLEKNNNINFLKQASVDKVISFLNTNILEKKTLKSAKKIEKFEAYYNSFLIFLGMIIVTYFAGAIVIDKKLDENINMVEKTIATINTRINKIEDYKNIFNHKISEYEKLINNIENRNNATSEDKQFKNLIPNLLNNIMTVIPKSVKLVSIENTTNKNIIIKVQSKKYEQVAYFKTKLKTEEILENVVSDTGIVKDGYLNVTIEGELP